MGKKKYTRNIQDRIADEETLTSLLKERFRLIAKRANIRSNLHLSIAVGDHEATHTYAKSLREVNEEIDDLDIRIKNSIVI